MDMSATGPTERMHTAREQLHEHGFDGEDILRGLRFAEALDCADEDQRFAAALLYLHYQGAVRNRVPPARSTR